MTDESAPTETESASDDYSDLSLGSYHVASRFGELMLSGATAFFIARGSDTYLITNWHVVTGRNSETQKLLSTYGSVPDNLLVRVYKDAMYVEMVDFEVPLYDESGVPVWKEHPVHGGLVDVVAIKVIVPSGLLVRPIEGLMDHLSENAKEMVADDVFILGFPFGVSASDFFPVWKRASIATEPQVDIANLPKMLVDTASRSGMSGSPVVLYQRRPVTLMDKGRLSRRVTKLVGVYSGRIGAEDPEFKAQLGIVWKVRVIDEIISGDAVVRLMTQGAP